MKTALLIIDCQVFFAEMIEVALPKIKMLHEYFAESSRIVIFTQHGHTKDDLIPPITNQIVRNDGPENTVMVDTPRWQLHADIVVMAKDATIVKKNTYDAFLDTRLYPMLRAKGIQRVLIAGVMSDVCCNSTARSAFDRGFETWFVSDACYSENEEQHERAVKDMKIVISRVHTAAEALAMLMEEKA